LRPPDLVRKSTGIFLALGLVGPGPSVASADTFSRGSVSVESRAFDPDNSEETDDFGVALVTRLEIKYRPGGGRLNLVLRGLARFDAIDSTRNIGTLEDAYLAYAVGRLTLRVGSQIVNWTTTEAFHPADTINSRNFDSDLDNLEKLGEPMVELQLRILQGSLAVFYMPMRIDPNVLPAESRLSFVPSGVQLGDPLWLGRDGTKSDSVFENQVAVQFKQTVGPADIALHVVDHSDRHQPSFTFDAASGEVRPTYHSVTQFGLTYVHVLGSLIVKLEAVRRGFRSPDPVDAPDVTDLPNHDQVAGGLEYGWVNSRGHDAAFIVEGQYVRASSNAVRRQLHVFQGDMLVGYRHAFNDEQGRELVFGFITDLERPYEYLGSARYAQRLSDTWSIGGFASSLRLLDVALLQAQFTLTRNF
jgi:hypothetical protein